jgi:hypothetical protein
MALSPSPPQAAAPAVAERVTCSLGAALRYGVPANVVLAVAEQEGGRPGQWARNRNGTFDVGALQFNTAYLRSLAPYGIGPAEAARPGCYAYHLAAWRLRQHLAHDAGDLWTRAANYHSRTPSLNAAYRAQIMVRGARWARWLHVRWPNLALASTSLVFRPPARPVMRRSSVSSALRAGAEVPVVFTRAGARATD